MKIIRLVTCSDQSVKNHVWWEQACPWQSSFTGGFSWILHWLLWTVIPSALHEASLERTPVPQLTEHYRCVWVVRLKFASIDQLIYIYIIYNILPELNNGPSQNSEIRDEFKLYVQISM